MRNNIVTYHSFYTSTGNENLNPFVEISLNPLLRHIEQIANCLIKTKFLKEEGEIKKGYWFTEIYYHQIYGKHGIAIRMIDDVLENLKKISKIRINRTSIKTLRGFHPIEDQEVSRSLRFSAYPNGFRQLLMDKYRIRTSLHDL